MAHKSSLDPFNTTKAAKAFFALAIGDNDADDKLHTKNPQPIPRTRQPPLNGQGHSQGGEGYEGGGAESVLLGNIYPLIVRIGSKLSEKMTLAYWEKKRLRNEATKYLRAVCRVFLVDFVCLQYPLPSPCSDLQLEFERYVDLDPRDK